MALTSDKLHDLADDETAAILRKGKSMIRDLKRKNTKMKQDLKLLANNNKAMEKLIEVLEDRVKKLTADMAKRYVYSYEDGGWLVKGSMKKRKAKIKGYKDVQLDSINAQLEEILRLIMKHKRKLK